MATGSAERLAWITAKYERRQFVNREPVPGATATQVRLSPPPPPRVLGGDGPNSRADVVWPCSRPGSTLLQALHSAAASGDMASVLEAVAAGAAINEADEAGNSRTSCPTLERTARRVPVRVVNLRAVGGGRPPAGG